MREIILDTETTGLSYRNGDRVIEIGCVELVNREITGNVFHRYINPSRSVSLNAFKVHGISSEFLKDKEDFSEIVDDFMDFIKEDTLVMHNASFDRGFIDYELERINKKPLKNKITDTLSIARKKFPGDRASLDALCKRFKIDNSGRGKHGALKDSFLLAKVYFHLVSVSQFVFDFQGFQTINTLNTTPIFEKSKLVVVKPSQTEFNEYKKFFKSFFFN